MTAAVSPITASHESAITSIRSIVHALRVSTRSLEKNLGVSLAQLEVLRIVSDGECKSLNALAARTGTHQSSVSVVVSTLVERCLVETRRDKVDKRLVIISATAAGSALVAKAPSTVIDALVAGLRRMDAGKRVSLARLLEDWLATSGIERADVTATGSAR